MDKQRLHYLLQAYHQKTATPQEKTEFTRVLHDQHAEYVFHQLLDEYWETLEQEDNALGNKPAYGQLLSEIKLNPRKATSTKTLWRKISIAAAIVVTLSGIGLYFRANTKSPRQVELADGHDISPGRIGATLTLSNGKKINLGEVNKGEVIRETGISISKTADGQVVYEVKATDQDLNGINTLSTAKGETYMITLPDRSKVWLNAASSLTYRTAVSYHGQRKVKLSGEAYFEVAKDNLHPFIVESGDQQVEVLGTHFNVNAYADEKAYKTTLLEGSVKVQAGDQLKTLLTGMQATNTGGNIKTSNVDAELATAWKNNNFAFDRLDIKAIMRMVERWYNVKVIYVGDVPSGTFWGSVSRFDNVSKVLIPLEATGDVHFEVKGREIYVSR